MGNLVGWIFVLALLGFLHYAPLAWKARITWAFRALMTIALVMVSLNLLGVVAAWNVR